MEKKIISWLSKAGIFVFKLLGTIAGVAYLGVIVVSAVWPWFRFKLWQSKGQFLVESILLILFQLVVLSALITWGVFGFKGLWRWRATK